MRVSIAALLVVFLIVGVLGGYELRGNGPSPGTGTKAGASATTADIASASTTAGVELVPRSAVYRALAAGVSVNYAVNLTLTDIGDPGLQPGIGSFGASPFEIVAQNGSVYDAGASCSNCGSTLEAGQQISVALSSSLPSNQSASQIEFVMPFPYNGTVTVQAPANPAYVSSVYFGSIVADGRGAPCAQINQGGGSVVISASTTAVLNGSFGLSGFYGAGACPAFASMNPSNVTLASVSFNVTGGGSGRLISPTAPVVYQIGALSAANGSFSISVTAPAGVAENIVVSAILTFDVP